jgi:AraC family L-rhamnose operon transcriptional activator RhaR
MSVGKKVKDELIDVGHGTLKLLRKVSRGFVGDEEKAEGEPSGVKLYAPGRSGRLYATDFFLYISGKSRMRPLYTIQQASVRLSNETPVRVARVELKQAVPPHDHTYSELTVIVAGEVEHRTQYGRERLCSGAVIVMPPGACHAFAAPRDLVLYNLYFLGEWLAGDLGLLRAEPATLTLFFQNHLFARRGEPRPEIGRIEPAALKLIRESLGTLERESSSFDLRHDTALRLSLLRLLVLVGRGFAGRETAYLHRPEIRQAITLIEHALLDETLPTLPDLARRCGLSVHHLGRLFRAETGLSLWAYIQRRRIDYAARLLLDPSLTLTEIAYRLQFTDSSHFTRSFAKLKGGTPTAFRRTFRKAPARLDKGQRKPGIAR